LFVPTAITLGVLVGLVAVCTELGDVLGDALAVSGVAGVVGVVDVVGAVGTGTSERVTLLGVRPAPGDAAALRSFVRAYHAPPPPSSKSTTKMAPMSANGGPFEASARDSNDRPALVRCGGCDRPCCGGHDP